MQRPKNKTGYWIYLNLMKIEEKKLLHFFNNVLVCLNLHGWKLRLETDSSEGYCWKGQKIIDLGLNHNCPKELMLHEIAHISTCRFCNHGHNFTFWKTFDDLVRRFLSGHVETESSKLHRSFASGVLDRFGRRFKPNQGFMN